MAFVFAPIAVCEELADILIACDAKERVRLPSEASDGNESVLAKIMRSTSENKKKNYNLNKGIE